MNDENNKRIIKWWIGIGDFAPGFEEEENPYWEDVHAVIPSREEIEKYVKVHTELVPCEDRFILTASYGPDHHGYCAEEHYSIDYDQYIHDSRFVSSIKEKLIQDVAVRIVRMYEKDRIKAAMTAENSIKKYNVMPAIKKEENKMSIIGKKMIATVGGGVDIADIQVYNNKVVKVVFSDGTFTKSVCGENDTFDLDIGITICVIKKMAGKDGHRWYNNMIREAHAVMEERAAEKALFAKIGAERKARIKKEQEKRKAGREKAKQEQIDIHSEAFLTAIKTWNELGKKYNGAVGD